MELGESMNRIIVYCEQAIQIAEEVNDLRSLSGHLGNLGNVHRTLKQYNKALVASNEPFQNRRTSVIK